MGQGFVGPDRRGLIRVFDRAVATLACLLLSALIVTVLLGVVTRAADAPLIWTDEGARFEMAWLACTGWMLAGRRRAHVRIRYFQELLPDGAGKAFETLIELALGAVGLGLAWFGIDLVRRNAGLDATTLPLSMAWLYVPIIPAGLVMAAQAAAQAIERGRPARAIPIGEDRVE